MLLCIRRDVLSRTSGPLFYLHRCAVSLCHTRAFQISKPKVLPFVPSTALAAVVQPNLMLFSNVTRRTRRSGALPAFTMGYSHWSVRPSLSTDLGSGQCLLFAQRQPVPKPTEQR